VATCAIPATEANVIPASGPKTRDDSQTNLVKRAQAGDEQAFATLFQQHKNRVYSVCLLMTKDVAEAEDLTQEAFLQVFRTVSSFRGDAAFSTWLYRVAVNTVLMKLRRLRKELLEFCAMFSRGWTATGCSEKCVFIGTLPVNKSKRRSCGCLP